TAASALPSRRVISEKMRLNSRNSLGKISPVTIPFCRHEPRIRRICGVRPFPGMPFLRDIWRMQEGGCLFGACRVRDRVGGNGVDYRCECAQFPCEEHGFTEWLRQRWEADNRRIGEVGIENYYEEVKNRPRYPQAPGFAAKCLPCLVWNGECRSPRGHYNYSR
ncbi:MAG: C_GCAxxG_C_C family protein, partial [Synergistales bacterium 57_84]